MPVQRKHFRKARASFGNARANFGKPHANRSAVSSGGVAAGSARGVVLR